MGEKDTGGKDNQVVFPIQGDLCFFLHFYMRILASTSGSLFEADEGSTIYGLPILINYSINKIYVIIPIV